MKDPLPQILQLEEAAGKQLDALQDEGRALVSALQASRDKLYKRRQELVSGKALPTPEELSGFVDEPSHQEQPHQAVKKGVPLFWLTALVNNDELASEISSRDKAALAYCTSVRAVYSSSSSSSSGPAAAPTLEMSFSANPFFSNATLRRRLPAASGSEGGSDAPEVTTDIDWKSRERTLTLRAVVKKGGKKGGGGKGKGGGKKKGRGGDADDEEPHDGSGGGAAASRVTYRACDSFFSFFLPDDAAGGRQQQRLGGFDLPPGVGGDSEDEAGAEDEQSAKQERDEAVMALLLEQVLPHAATLFCSGPLQAPSDEEGDEDFQVVQGASGGSPHDLPGPVRKVLAALEHNQEQLDALAADSQKKRGALKAKQSQLRATLAQQRRALLLPDGAAQVAAERFYLRVLRSADAAALAISPRDAAVLACLADVRFALDASSDGSELHGRLELEFLPGNPFLQQPLLAKVYSFDPASQRMLSSKVVAAPVWADPSRDPTHKRGRDGKQRPAASFFQLFKPQGGKLAFNLTGDARDVQDEANELETELLQELHGHVLLRCGHIYSELAAAGWDSETDSAAADAAAWDASAAEAEGASDSEDEDGQEDEGEAAHAAALRRSKAKAAATGSWMKGRGGMLVVLIGLMLLGELFVLIDMLRSR